MENSIDRLSQAYRDAGFEPIAEFEPQIASHFTLVVTLCKVLCAVCVIVMVAFSAFWVGDIRRQQSQSRIEQMVKEREREAERTQMMNEILIRELQQRLEHSK